MKKQQNRKCIKCGEPATIYGRGIPTCCDDCYEKIKAWRSVNLYLPYEFTTTLQDWEYKTPMDALKMKYERKAITEVELKVEDYANLVDALEIALNKRSEVVLFGTLVFSIEETEQYISSCEQIG